MCSHQKLKWYSLSTCENQSPRLYMYSAILIYNAMILFEITSENTVYFQYRRPISSSSFACKNQSRNPWVSEPFATGNVFLLSIDYCSTCILDIILDITLSQFPNIAREIILGTTSTGKRCWILHGNHCYWVKLLRSRDLRYTLTSSSIFHAISV